MKRYGLHDSYRFEFYFSIMFISETTVRVRYNETDKMGYVYHGNYPQYFEIGRTDALRQVGLTYKEFEEKLKKITHPDDGINPNVKKNK